jgi:hypothetical protein
MVLDAQNRLLGHIRTVRGFCTKGFDTLFS